jgi:hypothetical protein
VHVRLPWRKATYQSRSGSTSSLTTTHSVCGNERLAHFEVYPGVPSMSVGRCVFAHLLIMCGVRADSERLNYDTALSAPLSSPCFMRLRDRPCHSHSLLADELLKSESERKNQGSPDLDRVPFAAGAELLQRDS